MDGSVTAVSVLVLVAAGLAVPPCLASPAGGASTRIPLRSGWAVQSSAKVAAAGAVISKSSFEPKGWYPTSVPATVVAALHAAGELPDPNFGMNLRQYPGMSYPIGLNSFNNVPMDPASPYAVPWWYRTEFELPAEQAGRVVWLDFEGINYRANVWLNGRLVATDEDLAGAYRLHELNVTSFLLPGRTNALAVEVFAPTPTDLAINWVDWNPTPPDKNMGLWGDVYLRTSGPVSVRHPHVVTRFPGGSLATAHLTVMAEIGNATDAEVAGECVVRIGEIVVRQGVRLAGGERRTVRFTPEEYPALRIREPRLWWPAEMGRPELHDLHVRFTTDAALSDEEAVRFGIREVTSELNAQGQRLFRVNGKPILVRGGEWAKDMLLRPQPRERLEAELEYVLDMGLNTLRMEGQLESDEFLDLTDEKGLLVMAGWCCCDIWEKWGKWPAGNLRVATESLRTQMLKMRRHPSMLTWLNGSDMPPIPDVERAYLEVLEDVAWPNPVVSSASASESEVSGPSGVKMTGPYDYEPPSYWLTALPKPGERPVLDSTRHGGALGYNTETGPGPAIPPLESLRKMLTPDHLWPIDEHWSYHACGERFMTPQRFNQAMDATYGAPADLADYLRKAQAMAYDGQRAMFEAHRRNKYSATGVIQWTLNNAWPSIFWHLYDYYLYPAGGYFGTKMANAPLQAVYGYDDRSVAVVSHRRQPVPGVTLQAQVFDFALRPLFSREVGLEVAADSVTRVLTLPALPEKPERTVYFVRLRLRDATGQLLTSNFYWLPARPSTIAWNTIGEGDTGFANIATFEDLTRLNDLRPVKLDVSASMTDEAAGDGVVVRLHNPSPDLAFQVHLGVRKAGAGDEVLPVLWEDNYLALMPGESRTIRARYLKKNVLGARPTLAVDGWNVRPLTVAIERTDSVK